MRTVHRIESLPFRKSRLALYDVEQQRIAVFYRAVIDQCGIRQGMSLNTETYQNLIETETRLAMEKTMEFLGRKAYSQKEMEAHFHRLQYEKTVISEIMQRLRNLNLVNDSELAGDQAEILVRRGYSRNAIKRKLGQRGIDSETLETALEICSEEEEQKNAIREAETLMHRYRDEEEKKCIMKVSAAMARKGFSWDVIRHVIELLTNQDPEEMK